MFEPEETRIARGIKDFMKSKNFFGYHNIMLRDGQILDIDNYRNMVISGKINPQDAYVYMWTGETISKSVFYYPFIVLYGGLLHAYLSKLGFYYEYYIFPATGLKYVTFAPIDYYTKKYLSIELVNIDIAANNTNLPKIVVEALDGKLISLISGKKVLSREEEKKIFGMFSSQRLFAGYDFDEAWDIIYKYYENDNKSLVKEVARIAMDYGSIFQPYRVCYDMKTWEEIDCWSFKLD